MKWKTKRDLPPFCIHCKKKRVERKTYLYCSQKCYTDSGFRKECGKINGKKAYSTYWKKFDEIFYRKYNHLSRVDQLRLLVNLGMKRAYRKTYNQKFKGEKLAI